MSVIQPDIDNLLEKVDSKYTLVIVSSRRARQVNDMIHGVRDQAQAALGAMPTGEIAKLTSTKPLSLAMTEIESGDVGYERVTDTYK